METINQSELMDGIASHHDISLNDSQRSFFKRQFLAYDDEQLWSVLRGSFLGFYLMSLILMILWRNKVISHIFVLKLLAMIFANVAHFLLKLDWIKPAVSMGLEHLRQLLLMMEQILSLLLAHEIYRCICRVEKRKYKVLRLLGKSTIAAVLVAAYIGIEAAVYHRFQTEDIVTLSSGFAVRLTPDLIITLMVLYFTSRILLKLNENRPTSNRQRGKENFVICLLVTVAVSQITKFILKTVTMSETFIITRTSFRCLDMPNLSDLMECTIALEHLQPEPGLTGEYCCMVEFLLGDIVMIYKKIKAKSGD